VFCGMAHACALSSGNTYCWGYNFYGQIGASSVAFATISQTASQLSIGFSHTCGLFSGTAQCFGYNGNGQLGRNSSDGNVNAAPTNTIFEGALTDIACGTTHTCVRLVSGVIQCLGAANFVPYRGQLGSGSTGSINVVTVVGIPASFTPTTSRPSRVPSRGPTLPTTNPTRNPVGRPSRTPTKSPTSPPITRSPSRKTSAGVVLSANVVVFGLLLWCL
jgi:alpha-tubulin suppressor-like RCC1 family protein